MNLLAKSQKQGNTSLIEHSTNVAKFAEKMVNILGITEKFDKTTFKNLIIVSALLHDVGKCESSFQDYIKKINSGNLDAIDKDTHNDYIRHPLIGWAILHYKSLYINGKICKGIELRALKNALLYHHPIFEEDSKKTAHDIYNTLSDNDENVINEFLSNIISIAKDEFGITLEFKTNNNIHGNNKIEPYYFEPVENDPLTSFNYKLSLLKFTLISADRYASEFEENKNGDIDLFLQKECYIPKLEYTLPTFEDFNPNRFNEQISKAKEATESSTAIISAPAGYGKTILGLLWASMIENKKLYWVCPMNSIAEATYDAMIQDLNTFGFNNAKVGLYLTDQWKEGDENSNIIITNIDNWLAPSFKNRRADDAFQLFNSNVVFDEFHEYVQDSGFFAAFINFMQTRHNLCNNSKTLLLSATTLPISHYWEMNEKETKIIKCDSHLGKTNRYRFNFAGDYKSIPITQNMMFMFNSINLAQEFYVLNSDKFGHLIHSRYNDTDKAERKRILWNEHNKKNVKINRDNLFSTVSTRIVSTGFDISFKTIAENILSPHHTLQTIGRSNRFGEYENEIIDIYFFQNLIGGERSTIDLLYNLNLCKKWYEFLKEVVKSKEDSVFTLSEIYKIYDDFMNKFKNEINTYIKNVLVNSEKHWVTVHPLKKDRVKVLLMKDKTTTNNIRSSSHSMYYICEINNSGEFISEPLSNEITLDLERDFLLDDYEFLTDKNERKKYLNRIEKSGNWEEHFGWMEKTKTQKAQFKSLEKMAYETFKDLIQRTARNSKTPFMAFVKQYNSVLGAYKFPKENDLIKKYQNF